MAITINGTSGISGVDGSAATPALQGTDTNTGISFGSDVIIGSTGGVERWRTTPSGQWLVGTSSATANGGVLQVSNGITFPATQSACSNPNTLDDYEEGSWTPTLPNGGTFTLTSAKYTKIGNICYLNCYLSSIANIPNNGNEFFIGGLPFTGTEISGASISYMQSAILQTWLPGIAGSVPQFFFHRNDGTSARITNSTNAIALNGNAFVVSGWYYTS